MCFNKYNQIIKAKDTETYQFWDIVKVMLQKNQTTRITSSRALQLVKSLFGKPKFCARQHGKY